jgi:hypothetical protein
MPVGTLWVAMPSEFWYSRRTQDNIDTPPRTAHQRPHAWNCSQSDGKSCQQGGPWKMFAGWCPSLTLLEQRKLGRSFVNNLRVFVDLQNADRRGRLRLNCIGTIEDLARQRIMLRNGVYLTLYSEELEVEGVVEYSTDEHLWVAVIDWSAIKDIGPQVIIPES